MTDHSQLIQLPALREHEFRSNLPLLGSLIGALRRGLYRLTAKWGVLALINQQNQINSTIADQLSGQAAQLRQHQALLTEHDARLIAQDHDMVELQHTVAEMRLH